MKWYEFIAASLVALWKTIQFAREYHSIPPVTENSTVGPLPVPLPPNEPTMPPDPLTTLLPWDMSGKLSHNNWHNVRVICDQEGLTHDEKEDLTATVWGESDFDVHAIHENYVTKTFPDGTTHTYLSSTDHGVCQWNDKYHPSEVQTPYTPHPEKELRSMCHYWKMGETYKDWWIAHRNGRYLQFKGKKL